MRLFSEKLKTNFEKKIHIQFYTIKNLFKKESRKSNVLLYLVTFQKSIYKKFHEKNLFVFFCFLEAFLFLFLVT